MHEGPVSSRLGLKGIPAAAEEVVLARDLILAELGLPPSMKTIVPDRPSHDRRYLLDSSKLRTELGWAPETRFHDGIKTTVAWYRDNQQWWEPLLERAPVEETTWR